MLTEQASKPKSWLILFVDLCYILNVLTRKEYFTDRELEHLQEHIDEWAENWVAVNGREGSINYTHAITCHTVPFCESGGTCTGTPTRD
jgi:hypothetical protein